MTPEGVEMQSGDQFELDATYCAITCSAKAPVAIEHVGNDKDLSQHPAYRAFKLESYIGVPICLNGEVYGTLNFSSATPYPREFLAIDIDALQLMAAWIEVELVRRQQEEELNALNQKLKYIADYDSLTNILNRRGMYKYLRKDFNQLNRDQAEGSLAMIDIDHFKKLNDTYGHLKGDKALVAVADKINESLRDYDFVARFGGEEFLVWLPHTNQEKCIEVCLRIMENIAKVSVVSDPITVSIGVCHFRFSDKKQDDMMKIIEDLVAKADSALYKAKSEGRNRVVSHGEQIIY